MNKNHGMCVARGLMLLLALVLMTGCGGEKKGDEGAKGEGGESGAARLGDVLPDLDGGSLSLAGPKGWEAAPRKSSYVVKFNNPEQDGESVYVCVEDCGLEIKTLSESNAQELKEALGKKAKSAKIDTYNGVTCVRYAYTSRDETYTYSTTSYSTIQNGRQYDFFYRIPKALEQYGRPSLLKDVFKSAKFAEPGSVTEDDEPMNSDFAVPGDFGGDVEEAPAEVPAEAPAEE